MKILTAAAVQAALSICEEQEPDGETADPAVLQRIALDYLNKADESVESFI